MQAYGEGFARVYNKRWSGFARQVAPLVQAFYESTPTGKENKTLLDVCCGTGQLAVHFLEAGYRVVGLDLSKAMLHFAEENAREHIEAGRAAFVHGDASDFALDKRFGLVASLYDSLNHLESEQALRSCFACVHAVCDGVFVFDLNTRAGLRRWNGITVDDGDEEALVITRGIYDGGSERAWTRITGFSRTPSGLYERFDETAYNTVFEMESVKDLLLETGWESVHFARAGDLATPLADPEAEGRVFVIASK
jgi:SAM-dependent methyltransferase